MEDKQGRLSSFEEEMGQNDGELTKASEQVNTLYAKLEGAKAAAKDNQNQSKVVTRLMAVSQCINACVGVWVIVIVCAWVCGRVGEWVCVSDK